MGNCSSSKRKRPIPPRKGSSNAIRRVLLDDSKKEGNIFRRSLSKEENFHTSNEINFNISSARKKDNNKIINNIIPHSKNQKSLIIKLKNNNKSNNKSLIKIKSKEKINNLKNYTIRKSIISNNSNSGVKSKYIHIKNRSSSSRYDSSSINSSITNNYSNSQLINNTNNNIKIFLPNKVIKTSSKCKNKNRIPRSTFESNNSNISSSNTRNCKVKLNNVYCNTYNEINDENINIINKNIFNIYNHNNININFYQTKNINSNSKNKEIYKCIKTIEGHKEKIVSMIELSNGLVATGSYDSKIKIWDIENAICIKTINENGFIFCLLEMEPNFILSGTNKNTIQLFNINSPSNINEKIFSFKSHDLWVNCLVKCNSQFFSSGSNDAEIKIWDYYKKSLYKSLKGHEDCILTMTLLKNERLCSGSADLTIKIWDWKEGKCINTLTGHEKWVKSLCQLENGNIISGSDDMIIKIWKENKCIKEFMGHRHSIRTLCIISQNIFASGSFDGTIKIWNLNSMEAIQTLVGDQSYVISVIKISNGDLISCSNDHSIKIWRKQDC